MNREILFKAKRKDNGEWIEGYFLLIEDYINDFSERINVPYIIPTDNFNINYIERYEVILETICQYTGLKDKNGVKIFEGDIVSGITGKPDGNDLIINNMKVTFDYMDLVMLEHTDNLEVIGNVFAEEVKEC